MNRLYHAARSRGGFNPLGVGIVAIGNLFRVTRGDVGQWPIGRYGTRAKLTTCIVRGFLTREVHAARRTEHGWESTYNMRPMSTCVVETLDDGRLHTVDANLLIALEEAGFGDPDNRYPDIPAQAPHSCPEAMAA